MTKTKKIQVRDLKCPKFFYQYWPLRGRKVGEYYCPEITVYSLTTSEYAGQTHYYSEELFSFIWQCKREGDGYNRPYGLHMTIDSTGLQYLAEVNRIVRHLGYVGFCTTPKEIVRALRQSGMQRWQHEPIPDGSSYPPTSPIPHKYAKSAVEYVTARSLVA